MQANDDEAKNEEKDDDAETNDDGNLKAAITPAQATAAAQAAYPGGTITKSPELEDEDGVTIYGVAVTAGGKKYDVKVNGSTGKVLKCEADDEKEESECDGEKNDDK
jgi:uncharacterized membrane protein YkoI